MPAGPPAPVTAPADWLRGTWWQRLAVTLGIAVVYVLTARIGQTLAMPPGNITPVWLPSGIMLALAVVWGPRVAPGVFLGAFVGNAWAYFAVDSLSVTLRALAAGASNGLGDVLATVGMALLLRFVRGRDVAFERVGDIPHFVFIGGILGGLISAVFGVGALVAMGFLPTAEAAGAFFTWWTGDTVGVLVLAPVLLVWRQGVPRTFTRAERLSALLVLAATPAFTAVAFDLLQPGDLVELLMVVLTPIVLWVGLSLGRRVSFLALVLIAAVAIIATTAGMGPFHDMGAFSLASDPQTGLIIDLQVFLAGLSTTVMVLSVLATQRAAARAELLEARDRLEGLYRTDALTLLPNRRHIQEALEDAEERSARHDAPFSVLLVDIDHFKRVNDRFGHNEGDRVLQGVAQVLGSGVRAVDLAGRWGGEEFLIVLDRCAEDEAAAVAEALRRSVAARDFAVVGRVTVSVGVAESWPAARPNDLVARADAALYAAKAAGRDRVGRWSALASAEAEGV